MNSTILEVRDVIAGYGKLEVLHGVSLQIQAGEIACIIGANGAGKTTLLRTIFGLTDMRSGKILLAGEDITGLRTHRTAGKGIAYILQERNIFPRLTVQENLELGAYVVDSAQMRKNLGVVFERFPVLKDRKNQRAGTLSGGERKMVAIGMGLMTSPKVMLLDEPSLGLAPKIVSALFAHIEGINAAGTTILLVEQNARQGLGIANSGYVLELGEIKLKGSGKELLDDERVQEAYLGR